jgi:Cof subfamily protein (haloacid dehalogenase superfamily)
MPFPFRLVAVDLDGTLLRSDHSISPANRRAVQRLRDIGVHVVIASGRMHQATTRYADELGLEEPIISYNGAMVRLHPAGETWHHLRVPGECAEVVMRYCAEHGLHLNYYLDDHLYVARRGEWAEFYVRQTGSPMEEIGTLEGLLGTQPTKMILIDTPETTIRLLDHFRGVFGRSLYITRTNPEYLEFMHPEANKGDALRIVAERLGIPRDETASLGDGANDLPMIEWAGCGVAMANAIPEVLAAADALAPPHDEDGLATFVEQRLAE